MNQKQTNCRSISPAYTAGISALISGIFIHMFGLTNIMHNHDSIHNIPSGYGAGVSSGRWFLTVCGDIFTSLFGNYNMAWLNGVIFLMFIAASAYIIVSIFSIKKYSSAILIALLLVSFPSVTSTMFYRFTVGFYGLSIFLSVFAVWVLQRYRLGFPISAMLIALSMGIYQAYVPFTISLFVLQMIIQALEGTTDAKLLIKQGLYYCTVLATGGILYYIFTKVSLVYYGASLTSYQGIDSMGNYSIEKILSLIYESLSSVVSIFRKDYHNLAQSRLIRFAYLALAISSIMIIVVTLWKKVRNIFVINIVAVLCATFLIAINFIVVMGATYIYTLMVYPIVLILCVPVILADHTASSDIFNPKVIKGIRRVVCTLVLVIVFCYSYEANTNYTVLYYSNQQAQNYLTTMAAQIRMTPGYDISKKWVFIGKINDPQISKEWHSVNAYGGNKTNSALLRSASYWYEWFEHYVGIDIPLASSSVVSEMAQSEIVKNMPCWPNEGSIVVIDNNIVIKCQE